MGTLISLGVGRMEIDWGKNSFFRDHSALFKPEDVKMIPYYYVDDDGNIYTEEKEGLCRSLVSMKGRLELLGYTLEEVQMMYNTLAAEYSKDPFNLDIPYPNSYSQWRIFLHSGKIENTQIANKFT